MNLLCFTAYRGRPSSLTCKRELKCDVSFEVMGGWGKLTAACMVLRAGFPTCVKLAGVAVLRFATSPGKYIHRYGSVKAPHHAGCAKPGLNLSGIHGETAAMLEDYRRARVYHRERLLTTKSDN